MFIVLTTNMAALLCGYKQRIVREQLQAQPLNMAFCIVHKADRGTKRQFSKNICSEDDLRSRIFGKFVVKSLACLPLLGFSNI